MVTGRRGLSARAWWAYPLTTAAPFLLPTAHGGAKTSVRRASQSGRWDLRQAPKINATLEGTAKLCIAKGGSLTRSYQALLCFSTSSPSRCENAAGSIHADRIVKRTSLTPKTRHILHLPNTTWSDAGLGTVSEPNRRSIIVAGLRIDGALFLQLLFTSYIDLTLFSTSDPFR